MSVHPMTRRRLEVRDLDSGEVYLASQVDGVIEQLDRISVNGSVGDYSSEESAHVSRTSSEYGEGGIEWAAQRQASAVVIPPTPRATTSDAEPRWGRYEEAKATLSELRTIIQRALGRCKKDKRLLYDARVFELLLEDMDDRGVVIVADWPTRLLLHAFRDLIARFFGKPEMPPHGVLFIHRAVDPNDESLLSIDEYVCSYIDAMSIAPSFADANLSASYVAYKR
eukprot:CAMPEP_0206173510 /NCGR_PEP_ID=MMETSP1474-20131121/49141_1 /ASSEMBLY_ACC=CAM_ASM_001110 /TAXON_ID=97495 /ORGANISM="Imantonia sp., Strain RCC918" /LENGTH=224 /DNA_ID=CAMNT_0053582417 /DNA_START=20 /DNA_END=690 /DNA_ORIENTATION=+